MKRSPKKVLFMMWGWLTVPWGVASMGIGLWLNVYVGAGLVVLHLLWLLHIGQTTYSRCSSYGTGRCGVQSWIVRLFWAKKSMRSVSPFRVRLNMAFDVIMMVVNGVVIAFVPVLIPVYLASVALRWFVVYSPKQNHGLQPLLKAEEKWQAAGRWSLPVIATTTGEPHGCGS
ncbi:MAG: hypothetical protein ACOVT5_08570, partial [Armatimonadaceae bacterium]